MLVFQYGSNTEADGLNSHDRLQGDAVDRGLARTDHNFELHFDVWSHTNACAAADTALLYETPFMDLTLRGPMGSFSSAQVDELMAVVAAVTATAVAA